MESFNRIENGEAQLPPGFRFHPTDEELITYYLMKKVVDSSFTGGRAIAEVDINKCEPWELPEKAKMGEKEWYFFSLRDRKYPTGLRTNRATESGYWKATGKDREIYSSRAGTLVGMKKTLVFYKGRAPKGEKSNWVMHEYRLEGKFSYHYLSKTAKDEWVVSRIFQKSGAGKKNRESSYTDMASPSLPALLESSPYRNERESCCSYESETSREHVSCFSTAATAGNHPHNAAVSSNFRSVPAGHQFPEMTVGQFLATVPPMGGNQVSAFPSLRSLQENLQFPFFFPAVAPAGPQPAVGEDSGHCPAAAEQKVFGNRQQQLSELDCFWSY